MGKYTDKHVKERFETNSHYVDKTLDSEGLEAVETYRKKFDIGGHVNHIPYAKRKEQRYTIITQQLFESYYGEKILDVGSRSTLLTEKLGRQCELVAKHNKALPPFDWEKELLPYEAKSYDTVVCLDTLEHVDNLHEAFYDLLRVSRKHVIISLPNNWKKAFNEMLKGRGIWPSYGIPPEKPHDRHKWFFNTEDAEDFIYYNSAPNKGNYDVELVQYHMPKTIMRHQWMFPLVKLLLPDRYFKNLYVETMFYVLKKR